MATEIRQCHDCKSSVRVPEHRPKAITCKCPKCGAKLTFAANADDAAEPEQAEKRPPVGRQDAAKSGSSSAMLWTLVVVGVLGCVCLPVGIGAVAVAILGTGLGMAKQMAENPDFVVPVDQLPKDFPKDFGKDLGKDFAKDFPKDFGKDLANDLDKDRDGPKVDASDKSKIAALPERTHTIPFHAVAPRQRLEQVKTVQIKGRASFKTNPNVNDVNITWESLRRQRYDEQIGADRMTILLIGGQGWMALGANKTTLNGDGLAFYQNFNYATTLSNLIPLTEDGFQTESTTSIFVRGKPCYGVVVKRTGRPNLTMYFDKDSHLLYKAEFQGRFVNLQNLTFEPNTTLVEFFFSDYRTTDGIKHWWKQEQWRNGTPYCETHLSEVKFLNRSDDSLFLVDAFQAEIQQAFRNEKKELIQRTLSQLKAEPGSDLSRMVKALPSLDAQRKATVMTALHTYVELWRQNQTTALTRADVPALTALLRPGTDPALHAFAIDAIARLGPEASEAAPTLAALARDSRDAPTLTALLTALKACDGRRAEVLAVFEKHMDFPDAGVKNLSAQAMLEFAPDRIPLNRLTSLIGRPDENVRTAASKLLRNRLLLVKRQDMPALREGLNHADPRVQVLYVDAVASLKEEGREALTEITSLAGSEDKEVSAQAIRALDQMGKLTDIARDATQPRILVPAINALKAKGAKGDDTLMLYEKHLNHEDGNVNQAASMAMLTLAPEKLTMERLLKLMSRPSEEVRTAASKLVREKLTSVTAKDLPGLREGIKNPVREVRVPFIEAVGALKADAADAVPDLAELLSLADKDVVLPAIQALEKIGKAAQKAAPELAKAIENPDRAIALPATLALSKIEPSNATLLGKGMEVLMDGLQPDVTDPKAFAAQPLGKNDSAAMLIAMGEPAVAPVVKFFLSKNTPKTVEARRLEPTAARLMGYEMLKELAAQAKAKDDRKLITALKKHELALKAFWEPQESILSKDAARTPGMSAEHRMIYSQTATASFQAYRAISALKAP